MYDRLIDEWLGEKTTGEARSLATAVVGKVIERALDGDMAAVQWLEGKLFLTPAPIINLQFGGGQGDTEA